MICEDEPIHELRFQNTNRSDNAVKKLPLKDDLRGYFPLLHSFFLIPVKQQLQ